MAELRIEQDTLRDTVTINGVRYPRALFEDIAAVPTGDRVIRAVFSADGASVQEIDLAADAQATPASAPMEWYMRLATMALEAIEAGPNASLLMNLEGIKEHLRAAKDGKWPTWVGMRAASTCALCGVVEPKEHKPECPTGQAERDLKAAYGVSGIHDKSYFCPNCGVGTGCHHHSWCDRLRDTGAGVDDSGSPSDWVDANVSGNPTLMQAMKNFAENGSQNNDDEKTP